MSDIRSKLNEIYSMEQLAAGRTGIHRLHPDAKMIVTVIYIVCVASLGRYDLARLSPFLFYPVVMITLADLPAGMLLRRTAAALPFCLFAGISNVVFDRTVLAVWMGIPFTTGILSMLTLAVRTVLCVCAVLILTAVTPFTAVTDTLRRAHIPELIVTLLEMVYRFSAVLISEAAGMVTAFRLRSGGRNWPSTPEFVPFIGQLFLRSADRAQRVYQAMQCRGGGTRGTRRAAGRMRPADWIFLAAGAGSSVFFRLVDIAGWIGGLF